MQDEVFSSFFFFKGKHLTVISFFVYGERFLEQGLFFVARKSPPLKNAYFVYVGKRLLSFVSFCMISNEFNAIVLPQLSEPSIY